MRLDTATSQTIIDELYVTYVRLGHLILSFEQQGGREFLETIYKRGGDDKV